MRRSLAYRVARRHRWTIGGALGTAAAALAIWQFALPIISPYAALPERQRRIVRCLEIVQAHQPCPPGLLPRVQDD